MGHRSSWLFPLMVIAAGSVTAFGCIGLAAITGHLALTRGGANPLGDYPTAPAASIEQTVTPQPQPTTQPVAVVVVGGSEATKPIAFQPAKAVGARKRSSEQTLN
jgi:hypothetical protein